jgi:hypothetical protein
LINQNLRNYINYQRRNCKKAILALKNDFKGLLRCSNVIKKSSMEFALDLQNVTNHQNIFAQGYNKYTNAIAYEYQLGFFPVPMFRYTF